MSMESSSYFNPEHESFSIQRGFSNFQPLYISSKGYCRLFTAEWQGRRVVVKALKEEYIGSQAHKDLLYKEYIIGKDLSHPGLVRTLSFENNLQGIGAGIILEYVDGRTLKDFIKDESISKNHIYSIISQLCSALSYLHSRSLVHRDLKPTNIMLSGNDQYVIIIAFGLSAGNAYLHFKYPGGTRRYGAPEQFDDLSLTDARADIYALGIIMSEMAPHDRIITKVAKKCKAILPENRLSDVRKIPELINYYEKKHKKNQFYIGGAIAIIALGTGLWYNFYSEHLDQPSNHNITAQDLPYIESTSGTNTNHVVDSASIPLVAENKSDTNIIGVATDNPLPPIGVNTFSTDVPMEQQVYYKSLDAAKSRFKWQLSLLDTMSCQRSYDLSEVGYWKWLAKQDIHKWLIETFDSSSPYIDDLMSVASRTIEDYASSMSAEEYEHKYAANKRTGGYGATNSYSFHRDDGRLETHTLQEDGTWSIKIVDEKARQMRLHPEY